MFLSEPEINSRIVNRIHDLSYSLLFYKLNKLDMKLKNDLTVLPLSPIARAFGIRKQR